MTHSVFFSRASQAWRNVIAIALALFLFVGLHAAGDGSRVHGNVSNAATGAYLEGAVVRIESLGLRTQTDREGTFSFNQVPAGPHQLSIYYTGFPDWTQTVTVVGDGAPVQLTVALKGEEVLQLNAFRVTGEREGNAASITRQRNAPNVMNVISMDAYGNVADGNVGNFLQNLPGISANMEAGDVVGISVRGTPPEMNSVTLDGTRTSSPTIGAMPQGDRAVLIDQISADSIKEIEVTKGNRPDQPADALGGTVNLITKSAFDYRDRVITYRAGANLNTYRSGSRITPSFSTSYMDTFLDRKLGVALTASYTETLSHRDRVQTAFLDTDMRNTRARYLNDTNARQRAGMSANFEYRFSDDFRLWTKLSGNYYTFETTRVSHSIAASAARRVADYARVSRAAIEAGTVPRTTSNQTAGVAPGYTDTYTELLNATLTATTARESRLQRSFKAAIGGEKKFSDGLITSELSFNPSTARNNYRGLNATLNGIGIGIDTSNRERPQFTQTYGPSYSYGSDFSQYLGEWIEQPDRTEDDITNFRVDALKDLTIAGQTVKLKAGLDVRHQRRWFVNTYRPRWFYVGPDGVRGFNSATGRNDDDLARFVKDAPSYGLFNGYYPGGDEMNFDLIRDVLVNTPAYFTPNGNSVAFEAIPSEANETVTAEYFQGSTRFGHLTVLGGVRLEQTKVKGIGSLADSANPDATTIERKGDYAKAFPSLHLTYDVTRNFILRGSYSTSSARPGISQIVPNTTVSYSTGGENGTVTSSNLSLKPQYSKNFDFAAEWYLEPAGTVSVGAFRKDIKDFIATTVSVIGEGPDNGFGGAYEDFDYVTQINLGSAQIDGFEMNYSQTMDFLPKPFNTLTLWGNYTRLNTSGEYSTGLDSPLIGFVPTTYNAGLTYKIGRWGFRATHHFKSAYYFRAAAVGAAEGTFKADDPTWDFNVEYRLNRRVTIFADLLNAFNQWPDWYMSDPSRTYITELYGARLNVGISGRF